MIKKLLFSLLLLALPFTCFSADRYWVGGGSSANWNATGNTNWGTASETQDNASVPATGDDVFFDGVGVGAADCIFSIVTPELNSLDMTGYANTLSGTGAFAIKGTTGTTTVCKIAGTITWAGALRLNPQGTAQINLTTNGKTLVNVQIGYIATTGTVQLQDAFIASAIYLIRGTLDINDQAVSCVDYYSSNANTRTLDLGASTFTCTDDFEVYNTTNLTTIPGTSTIVMSGSAAVVFAGGGETYNTLQFTGAGSASLQGANTFANLTRTGTAAKTDGLSIASNQVVSGTLTLNGNSAINRLLVNSNTLGTARTLTAATVVVSNSDFRDITGAGAGDWDLSGASGGSGDCGGNTGITFTTSDDVYWYNVGAGTFDWSDATHWYTATGGGGDSLDVRGFPPLPQDDTFFDANSVTGTPTIDQDMPRMCRTLDMTGRGAMNLHLNNISQTVYGGWIGSPGNYFGGSYLTFEGRGAFNLNLNYNFWGVTINMVGGTLTSLANFGIHTVSGGFTLNYGTFDANGFNVTFAYFGSSNSNIHSILMGDGTWSCRGLATNSAPWNLTTTTNLTFDAEGSTIAYTSNKVGRRTYFRGGGLTYNDFEVTGSADDTGIVEIVGSNTFNTFTVNPSKTIKFTDGTIQTVSDFVAIGTDGNPIGLTGTSTGGWTIARKDWTQDANCQLAILFTEGSGETAADSSTNSYDGTFKAAGEPAWASMSGTGAPSYANYMVDFDGSDDYISGTAVDLQASNDFTYVIWFASDDTSRTEDYIFNNKLVTDNAIIYEYVSDKVEFFGSGYSGDNPRTGSQITLDDTDWHHIAYSYDGTDWIGYKDGVSIFSLTPTFTLNNSAPSNYFIGSATAVANFANIKISELGIFDRGVNSIGINDIKDYGLDGTGKTNAVEWCDISYSTATGGFAWNADANSNDNGNNSGWNFASGAVRRIILTQWKNTLSK